MLVLVIGDLHIPYRAADLPAKFKKLLVPGKIAQIVSTGNTTDSDTWDYFRSVAPDVRGVRGDCDDVRFLLSFFAPDCAVRPTFDLTRWPPSSRRAAPPLPPRHSNHPREDQPSAALPPSMVLTHGPLRIGVIHGHQVVPLGDAEMLAATARKMDVDVLISGGTHRFEAFESDGRFFLNPGSATGAFTPLWTPPTPAATPPATTGDAEASPGKAADPGSGASGEQEQVADEDEEQDSAAASSSRPQEAAGSTPPAKEGDAAATDAASGQGTEDGPTPSFALLDIQGNVVVTYVYTERDGDVSVEKMEYRKTVPA
ncbi:hypothetical protein BMF94_5304 [Rhodotorula taiwanensis]|uniref:Vacuolar protein sorting-associated protein 29 n=1 Tax=Rhodotorula taiwanensis TaxID=741276 RepID=A0A2S5B4H3_9BASI|nr:hypothetical protein BMF94_5304 [Rhodotorula taiwanensis]